MKVEVHENLIFVTISQSNTIDTRKAKAASGRLSFERGYNQRCQWYQNLPLNIPKLHTKFHQNWCTSFGEKCAQDSDIMYVILIRILFQSYSLLLLYVFDR